MHKHVSTLMGNAQGKQSILARLTRRVRVPYSPPYLLEDSLTVEHDALNIGNIGSNPVLPAKL